MRRVKIIGIGVLILGAIVTILLYNKTQMQAKSKTTIITSYPVSVTSVMKSQLSETLSLVGTIAANNDVAVVSETQGRVVAINAGVGDFKSSGAVLVQIDDELKKADFMKAEVNYERAKKDAERFKSLREERAATEWQKENAWQAFKVAEAQYVRSRKEYRDTKISTPIAGIVTSRPVDVGTMVQPGMVVANVVDISKLKVKLNVAEQDAFKLKAGDPVEITTDVYPGVKFAGKIASISAKADESHTYPVEITLPNSKEHPLKAGMFGRVNFVSMTRTETLAIPREALIGSVKNPQVFVIENGMAKRRDLVVGDLIGSNIAVLQGLREGETVVVSGQNNLKDSVTVDIVN
ncbi:MAG: efflux RND transporter periplasmic adaptor subunit [Bacteroidetes bacterium]|nr:efflux RND transporter periplasmic adaptor subunit [Bacteroidota bacterium]MCW5896522.1 efflux RND transporter periplasmic adaptor subunit [Bacteroidota bacterium]